MTGVGVLVVNFNGGERVLRAARSLLLQDPVPDEILVVDNASTDGSDARLAQLDPRITVWRQPANVGLARARNLGLARLATPLALVMDHDIQLQPGALAAMSRCLHESGAAVVCPSIRLLPESEIVQADGAEIQLLCALRMRHAFTPRDALPVESREVGGAIGACQLMRREAVIAAGGFEELMFFYQEDLEFSLRLRARGLRFWCEARAEVLHERAEGTPGLSFRGTGEYPARRAYLTMRHRLFTLLVHYQKRTLLLLAPMLLLAEIASAAMSLRKGLLVEWLRAWGWIVMTLPVLRQRRRNARRARRVGDGRLLEGGEFPLAQAYLSGGAERGLQRVFTALCRWQWACARRLLDRRRLDPALL